jgi:hypothetical protein
VLTVEKVDRDSVKFGLHLDLTGQPGDVANVSRELEHYLFLVGLWGEATDPLWIDMHVTGGASAFAATIGIDAR